jgi:hypothetical protein
MFGEKEKRMKVKKLSVIIFFTALSMVIGACAAAPAQEDLAYEMPMEAPAAEGAVDDYRMEESAVEAEKGYTSGTGEINAAVDRMVIYNAEMEIAVENPENAMEAVIKMAQDAGGFVVSSNLSRTYYEEGNLPRASLTVRVPAGQLDSIMAAIRNLTPVPDEDVIFENVSGQDVTAEYTDLESRLRNLEAAEQALVELMEQAQDPEDVLNIFDELTYYRGEIEVVKGRMRYLEESADLSVISLTIIPKESLRPIEIVGWKPVGTVKDAVEALIKAGQFVVDAAIWFGIFCLPFLIPVGIGVYILVRILRKRKAKKQAQKIEKIESPAEEA